MAMIAPRRIDPRIRELRDGTFRVEFGLDQHQRFLSRERAHEFAELLRDTIDLHRRVTDFVCRHAIVTPEARS